jgi:Tol biopolymer transport system component
LSPDGKQVAVGMNDGKDANIWIYDLSGASVMRQLTFGGHNRFPVWSADGQYITFQSDREGDSAIYWQRADGKSPPDRLTKPQEKTAHIPDSWSPRNEQLALEVHSETKMSLAVLSMKDRAITPLRVESATIPPCAVFSPEGRWIAYQTGEMPDSRILVQSFPPTSATFSAVEGAHPRWSANGKELFYTITNRVYAVSVSTEPRFAVTNPAIFTIGFSMADRRTNYDVTRDGMRILGVQDDTPRATNTARAVQVVLNWQEELKQRVAGR